ncbi:MULTISPECIES: M14 family metallopeptidase [Anaerostipes]|uniref:M14 family metallopeptidase n=1 Tax=Anaerostipes TaxID=207244 RepID=UPI0009535C9D|nr:MULTISPECIES: M14 family metallopeptidase [Anaerostipes]MCI5624213.1 M14 family metallopeptidase [Anaerostipes sp.]OLR58398.1 succinylglutamate desuccinylase [Anaerostipes sp. 494a]
MKKVQLYELKSLYRDSLEIFGYQFGGNEKTVCIVGAIRGNEVQQLYMCSKLVHILSLLEERGQINKKLGIMVVPSVNPYSLNTNTRFWATDNTDINRMFPGYDLGETTQRIAGGFFKQVNDYKYGIHFTSFYLEGNFTPHVRIMKTGFEDAELAKEFGMPYIMLRNPKPYDTTTLNYEWQFWGTKAFSVYTPGTDRIDKSQANEGINAVLRFLASQGLINIYQDGGYRSRIIEESELVTVRTKKSGILFLSKKCGDHIREGQIMGEILDTYEGNVIEQITAPCGGRIFYHGSNPLIYSNTAVVKIIRDPEAEYFQQQ